MWGQNLRKTRVEAKLTQRQLADRLGVTQAYVSMLEGDRRAASGPVLAKLASTVGLRLTALPLAAEDSAGAVNPEMLAGELGRLGYPGFQYLGDRAEARNPADVVWSALRQQNLEPRVTAALPWVLRTYASDLNWEWLVAHAKQHDLQNRLGYLVTMASTVSEKQRDQETTAVLKQWKNVLSDSRLLKEDTLCRVLTNAEKKFWRTRRSSEAEYWNVLTNLTAEHLPDAA